MFSKKARDSKRFRELAYPHLKLLYNLALRYSGKGHAAEDLVQETMYTAFKNFHQLRDEDKIRPWIVSILRNIYLREAQRNAGRREVDIDDFYNYAGALEEASVAMDPEGLVFKKLEAAALRKVIEKVPEKYREPLILSYMKGFSYREVSEALDMPMGTVMSSIFKAKAFIKKELLKLSRERLGSKVVRLDSHRKLEGK